MNRPIPDQIGATYRAHLLQSSSESGAFMASVEAFRELHPRLPWAAAALEVARLLSELPQDDDGDTDHHVQP